jgi:hypothetical protein
MTNGGVSPLKSVFLKSQATGIATAAPKNVITNIITPWSVIQPPAQPMLGKNAAIMSA